MRLDVKAYSDIGGRKDNEDTVDYRMTGKSAVAVVTDGLGGQGDGKAASQLVCKSLLRSRASDKLPDKSDLMLIFDQANRELISKQKNSFHMKTTAVYLCVANGQAIWAHIGDSRLYHLHNGKLVHYTLDHSASQLAVYMGEITRDEIPKDSGRSRLLHAMGVQGETPDIHDPIILEPGEHVFVLCSDGLWEYLSDSEVERAWEIAGPLEEPLDKMIEVFRYVHDHRAQPDCDNNSAVVVYYEV